MQSVLLAKCYKSAISILEEYILEVDSTNLNVSAKDYLSYFYYAGMVCIGLKKFNKALEMFKLALTIPAVVMSLIMVETYKKYILVSLLVHGNVEPLPKYASSIVNRMKGWLVPYQEFATAFSTNSTEDLHKCGQAHSEVFNKDRNFGLIKQCIQSLYRRNIQRLTQTYITLSLSDIAENCALPSAKSAETSILRMIEDGEIFATISQKDGMVSFEENPEHYDTNTTMSHLDFNIRHTIALVNKAKHIDEEYATSQEYIQRTLVHERPPRFEMDDYGMMEMTGSIRG